MIASTGGYCQCRYSLPWLKYNRFRTARDHSATKPGQSLPPGPRHSRVNVLCMALSSESGTYTPICRTALKCTVDVIIFS